MNRRLVEQPARPDDQQQRDQAAEDDHPIAGNDADRFEETDVNADPDQRPDQKEQQSIRPPGPERPSRPKGEKAIDQLFQEIRLVAHGLQTLPKVGFVERFQLIAQ